MFLSVPGIVLVMEDNDRAALGKRIEDARGARNWSKQTLAKEAGITTTTLRRAEAGLRVQDYKMAAILSALGMTEDVSALPQEQFPESRMTRDYWVMPPEIENGYIDVVRYVRAVQKAVPPLQEQATRLLLAAADLLSESGKHLLAQEGETSEQPITRPTILRDIDTSIYDDEAAYGDDEPKG